MTSSLPSRIEGYSIVSADGMLANAAGIMPDQLKLEADQRFFERGLDGVDVVVHGRHSHEQQRRSDSRRRLILSRQIQCVAADPSNKKAMLWNPAGATLEQAKPAEIARCGKRLDARQLASHVKDTLNNRIWELRPKKCYVSHNNRDKLTQGVAPVIAEERAL